MKPAYPQSVGNGTGDISVKSCCDDISRLRMMKSAFSLLRKAEPQSLKIAYTDGRMEPALIELCAVLDDMFSELKIRDACTPGHLVLIHFPFHVDWFLLREENGDYYEFRPYFTVIPDVGELGFFLRQEGFANVERLLALARALPVYEEGFTDTLSLVLTTLTARKIVTFNCSEYWFARITRQTSYDAWLEHEYVNSVAEEAGKVVRAVYAAYKTQSPENVRAQMNCWSPLIDHNRSNQSGLKTIQIFIQQEVAIILSDLFNRADGKQTALLLSHYAEIFQKPHSPEEMLSEHRKFLENTIQLMNEASRSSHSSLDPRIRQVVDYVQLHYTDRLQMSDLAQLAGLSTTYLSSLFRQETGTTLSDYIRKIRIHQAKILLRYKDISVTDVAMQCGYQDSSYFTREFRKECGCSPLEYRQNAGDITPVQGDLEMTS